MKSDRVAAVAAGWRTTSSYRSVVSCSADIAVRSRAIARTDPRQRMAHLPARLRAGQAARSCSVSTPKNGLGNSVSMLAMPGLNQASDWLSASMAATTSRPSLTTCTSRASENASTRASAQ